MSVGLGKSVGGVPKTYQGRSEARQRRLRSSSRPGVTRSA